MNAGHLAFILWNASLKLPTQTPVCCCVKQAYIFGRVPAGLRSLLIALTLSPKGWMRRSKWAEVEVSSHQHSGLHHSCDLMRQCCTYNLVMWVNQSPWPLFSH